MDVVHIKTNMNEWVSQGIIIGVRGIIVFVIVYLYTETELMLENLFSEIIKDKLAAILYWRVKLQLCKNIESSHRDTSILVRCTYNQPQTLLLLLKFHFVSHYCTLSNSDRWPVQSVANTWINKLKIPTQNCSKIMNNHDCGHFLLCSLFWPFDRYLRACSLAILTLAIVDKKETKLDTGPTLFLVGHNPGTEIKSLDFEFIYWVSNQHFTK